MIILYTGSQPDAEDRAEPRFPPAAEAETKRRIRGLFQDLEPRLVFGALAAGADIVIAEAAREEGIEFRALLPFDSDTFRETSVASSGQHWVKRYDRLLEEANVECLNAEISDSVYADHNGVMLDAVAQLADTHGERVWCLLVRPTPNSAVAESVTDDMASRAEGRGLLTLDVDPLASRARTFVAMPYGIKFDPILRRDVDCDVVFRRIYRPLLEDLDLAWNRADLAVDSGLIHVGMIDDLANSQIVMADLTATNFNVAYELGLRHVFARRSTVLISPRVIGYPSSTPPFDVGPIRTHGFDRSLQLTDEEAERAIKVLKPVLEAAVAASDPDSPVHEWFDIDVIVPPFARRALEGPEMVEIDLRRRVQNAIKSSAASEMLTVAGTVASATVDEQTRSALRIELAVSLLGEGEYREALALLETAQPEIESPLHRLWLHQTVMALRRNAEGADKPEYDGYSKRAEDLLKLALEIGYEDSESYGIWAGLLKRRILRGHLNPLEEAATFELMTDYYGIGFRADPQAYTGLNYVMALRLQSHKQQLTPTQDKNLSEALIVAKFLNDRDLDRDTSDPWATITDAELQLHTALFNDEDTTPAAVAYAKAGLTASSDVRRSATEQLRFLIISGDDARSLNPIIDSLTRKSDAE